MHRQTSFGRLIRSAGWLGLLALCTGAPAQQTVVIRVSADSAEGPFKPITPVTRQRRIVAKSLPSRLRFSRLFGRDDVVSRIQSERKSG